MRALVDIAKELGFTPDPNLTKNDWDYLVDTLKNYFLFQDTGLTTTSRAEQKRISKVNDLPDLIYYTNCLKKREGSDEDVQKNIDLLKSRKNKLAFPAPQSYPSDLETTPFIWHHSQKIRDSKPLQERFTVDIDLSSQKFPDMMKKLDRFITNHHASYKITNTRSRHRIDTLNMYLSESITPELAQEFYGIVKPCLDPSHHQQLNGQDIFIGSTPIQGIKIGPILDGERASYDERLEFQDKSLRRDITNPDLQERAKVLLKNWVGDEPHFDREAGKEVASTQPSLGMVSTAVELMNLMYYMIGKEGQNPFQLTDHDNRPYQKHISLTEVKEHTKMSDSLWKKVTSLFQKKETTPTSTFDWENSKYWSDVQIERDDRIYFGHRINLSSLTQTDREAIRAGLTKRHIQFTERRATTHSGDIYPGDLTIRVTEPKSIQQLRSFVFNWADGPHARPVSKSKAEYQAEQQLFREKRLASLSSHTDKPKWADKKYWAKTSGYDSTGKLARGYVMNLGDSNNMLLPDPHPFGNIGSDIIDALKAKGIDATLCKGFGNHLPPHMIKNESVVIIGEEAATRFETLFLGNKKTASIARQDYNGR